MELHSRTMTPGEAYTRLKGSASALHTSTADNEYFVVTTEDLHEILVLIEDGWKVDREAAYLRIRRELWPVLGSPNAQRRKARLTEPPKAGDRIVVEIHVHNGGSVSVTDSLLRQR